MTAEYALSDPDVVARVLAGSREEFGVLVERYLSMAHAVAFAHTGNQADAEDVTQEAFLQAFRSLGALRDRVKFPAWLAGIARHVASRARLQRQRQARLIEAARGEPLAVTPDLAGAELQALVRTKILELDDTSREVMLLHYFAGMTIAQAAEVLGISPEAAAKRIQRGREALGHKLLAEMVPALAPRKTPQERRRGIMALVFAESMPAAPQKSSIRQASPLAAWLLKGSGLRGRRGRRWVLALILGLMALAVSVYWASPRKQAPPVVAPPAPQGAAPTKAPTMPPDTGASKGMPTKGAPGPMKGGPPMRGKG